MCSLKHEDAQSDKIPQSGHPFTGWLQPLSAESKRLPSGEYYGQWPPERGEYYG